MNGRGREASKLVGNIPLVARTGFGMQGARVVSPATAERAKQEETVSSTLHGRFMPV